MTSRSIRHRISLVVLACVAIVCGIAVYGSFRHASREVQEWEDARLVEYATLIARLDRPDLDQFVQSPMSAQIELAPRQSRQGALSDGDRLPRDILFEVRDASRIVLASSLPRNASISGAWSSAHALPWTVQIEGTPWRLYELRDSQSGRTIRVMEPSNTRSDLASGTAMQIVWPLLVALPVLAVMLWFAIGRSLLPLEILSATIRKRDADSLTPLGIAAVPLEVRALVDAIDRLLLQLGQSIMRERAFTSDAAHELKTPLAAIKVHAQVALSTSDAVVQRTAMQRVVQGVDRSARLAEQLLLLARLDEHERIPNRPVAMRELVDEAVVRHAARAREKGITLSANGQTRRAIQADPVLIGILLDNLVDNAIKYVPAHGRVEISLIDEGRRQCIAVLDDGPGVAHSDLGRLADRFYRGPGVQSPGSGLGLSIVERIARYFDARVEFGTGLGGRGLGVIVEFPAQPGSQACVPAGESVAQHGGDDVARQAARSA